jgi:hypothetical protein
MDDHVFNDLVGFGFGRSAVFVTKDFSGKMRN